MIVTSLEFASLRKNFGSTTALVDVSFRCEPGEITVLTGATGAGKTTALRIAAGLTHPSEGEVLFSGTSLSGLRHPANVAGFCLDPTATHPGRNVRATLTHAALLAGGSKRDVKPMAEFIGLKRALTTAAGDLPAHQQYRLALGVALMGNPNVLVIDEPFDHLTDEDRPWLVGLLRSLANSSKTVLVSCGLNVDTTDFADRIITMRLGRISKDLRCDESAPSGPLQAATPPEEEFVDVVEPVTRAGRRAGMVPGGQPVASVTRARAAQQASYPRVSQAAPQTSRVQQAPAAALDPPAPPLPPAQSPTFAQDEPFEVVDEPDTLDDVFRRYVGELPASPEPALTAVVPTIPAPAVEHAPPTSALLNLPSVDLTTPVPPVHEPAPATSVLDSTQWSPTGGWGHAETTSSLDDWEAAYRPSVSPALSQAEDHGWDEPGTTYSPWSDDATTTPVVDRGWGLSATIGTPASTAASFATDVSLGNAVPSGEWAPSEPEPTYTPTYLTPEPTLDSSAHTRPLSMYDQVASSTFAVSPADAHDYAANLVGSRSNAGVGAQKASSYSGYSGGDVWSGSSEMSTPREEWHESYLDAPPSGYRAPSAFETWTPNETRIRSHG